MSLSLTKFRIIYIVIFSILFISTLLLVSSVLLIKQKQVQQYQVDNVETIEYRLPPLDLEKYKQIDKLK